ncbi:hypothetical protein ACFQE1_21195, partial [Halobium palmae]
MQFGEIPGLFLLVLLFLAAVLLVFAVTVAGAVLVALVAFPALSVLPTVRRGFLALAATVANARPDSTRSVRFLAVYVLAIETLGFALLLAGIAVFEFSTAYGRLLLDAPAARYVLLGVLLVGGIGVLVVGRRTVTGRRR